MIPTEDQAFLREILDYNPDTGVLTWLPRTEKHISNDTARKIWNKRFAGKKAGRLKLDGYWQLSITLGDFKKRVSAHRIIWVWMTGEIPDIIDHIDRNPSNNRWDNLRNADLSVNSINRTPAKLSASGVKGVYRQSYSEGWVVFIGFKGQKIYLGSSQNLEEAIELRKKGELKYHA